ncbi:MAG: hypothetical protein JO038_07235 [Alphaproteobacteria bacterium]|nr:hypothetical protein [Alphaproteobacteria bacterium]
MLARKPRFEPLPAPTPEPLPLSRRPIEELTRLDEIHYLLALLDQERVEAQQVLDSERDEERRLLERDAEEEDFAGLDQLVKGARRRIERADIRERKLLARAAEIEAAGQQEQWAAIRARYTDAAQVLFDATQKCQHAHAVLEGVRIEAQRLGFNCIYPLYQVVEMARLLAAPEIARSLPQAAPPSYFSRQSLGPVNLVRFTQQFGSHAAGSFATVPVERAKWFAERGIAREEHYNPWGIGPAPESEGTAR